MKETDGNKAFVFVVCGAAKHTARLRFSLARLSRFTSLPVYVVTDTARNEEPVRHDRLIDIRVPADMDDHRASIYLKTGLHRFLPPGNTYCFLDSDVVAISPDCGRIFEELTAPVSFASDLTDLDHFSPYALHCGCLEKFEQAHARFEELCAAFEARKPRFEKRHRKHEAAKARYEEISARLRTFETLSPTQKIKAYLTRPGQHSFAYAFLRMGVIHKKPWRFYDLAFRSLDVDKNWYLKDHIEHVSDFRYVEGAWVLPDGTDISRAVGCTHLREEIEKMTGKTLPASWRQWNGGVFLFDDRGRDFMEAWHRLSVEKFADPYWRTRDQGTLVALIAERGLENHARLAPRWNALLDVRAGNYRLLGDDRLELAYAKEYGAFDPIFIHYFHEFGNGSYAAWNWLLKKSGHEH